MLEGEEDDCGSLTIAHVNAWSYFSVPLERETHFFKSFSLSSRTCILTSISPAFRQEVVFVDTMVAEDYAGRGQVKDSHSSANGRISTVPITHDRWIWLRYFVVLLVQWGISRHCCRCCCGARSVGLWTVEERLH